MVNNVLVFSPTGKIIHSSINYPGSWHDSTVAINLINKIGNELGEYAICVDKGFPRKGTSIEGKSIEGKLVGPVSKLVS
jgi:hypothetical protein